MKYRVLVLSFLILLTVMPIMPLRTTASTVTYAPYSQTVVVQPQSYRYVSTTLPGSNLAPLHWSSTVSVLSNALQVLPAVTNQYNNASYLVSPLPNPYVITITNSQPIATPSPFDQLVNVTESELGQTAWQYSLQFRFLNLLFKNGTTPLYAWIQNYTSTFVLVWVKLPYGIPASSSVKINVCVTDSVQYPYTGINPAIYPGSGNVAQYLITITNSQTSPTPSPWVQEVVLSSSNVSPSLWSSMESYQFVNVYFTLPNGSIAPSWLENYTSTYAIWWVRTPGIPASSSIQINANIVNYNAMQKYYPLVGEAPTLSTPYGAYDNGNHVFYYYTNSSSLSGWLVHGSAGVSSAPPPVNGLPFGGHAFYANSYFGDYLNTTVGTLPTYNVIIEYYTYTTALGDFYFFANSSGYGQMARVGGPNTGWYGIASTVSWTSWGAPGGTGNFQDTWELVGVVVSGTTATEYLSNVNTRMLYGQEIGLNPNSATVSIKGNSIGLVGDAAGSYYITYWMGIIIRPLPPSGVMPSVADTLIYSKVVYDNGQNVFIQYGYFGNQVPSGWTINVYNGLFRPTPTPQGLEMINSTNEGSYAYTSIPNLNDYTVIVSWWYNGQSDAIAQELYGNVSKLSNVGNIGSTYGGYTPYASGGTVAQNEFYASVAYIKNATKSINTIFDGQGTFYVTTYFAIQGDTEWYGYANVHAPFQIQLPSTFSMFHLIADRSTPTVFIGAGSGSVPSYIYLDFVIVIPTPPNNVMPTTTVTSSSSTSSLPPITTYGLNVSIEVPSGTPPYGGFAIGYGVNYPAQGINGNYEPALPYGNAGVVVVLEHGGMSAFHLFLFYNGILSGNWTVGSFTTATLGFTYTPNQVVVYWNNGTQYRYTLTPSTTLNVITNTYTIDVGNGGTYDGEWVITSFQFYNPIVTPEYYATFSWTAVTLSNGVKALYGFTGAGNPLNITVSTNVTYAVKGIVKVQNYTLSNTLSQFLGNVNYTTSQNGLYLLLNVYPGTGWYLNVTVQVQFTAPQTTLLENFTVPILVYTFAERVTFPTFSNVYLSGQTISITNTTLPNFPPSLGYKVVSPAVAEIEIYGVTNGFVSLPYTFSETVSTPTTYDYVIKVFEDSFVTQTSGSFTVYPVSNQPVIFTRHPNTVYYGTTVKLTFLFVYNSPISNTTTFYQKNNAYEWSFAKLGTNNSLIEFKASWSSGKDGLLIITDNNLYLLPFNGSTGVSFVNNSVNTVQINVGVTHDLLVSSNNGPVLTIANTTPVVGLGFSYYYGPINLDWFYVSDIIMQSNGTSDQSYTILTGKNPSTLTPLTSGFTNASGYGQVNVTLTDTPYELVDIDWSGSTYTILNITVINHVVYNLSFVNSQAGVQYTGGSAKYWPGHGYFLTQGYYQYGYVIMNRSFVSDAGSVYCMNVYIQNESNPPADAVYFVLGPVNASYIHDGGMFPNQNSEGGVLAGVELYNATYNGYAGPGVFIYTASEGNGWYHVSVEPKAGQTVTLKLGVEANSIWLAYYISGQLITNYSVNQPPTFASNVVEIIGTTGSVYVGWVLTHLYVNETVSASLFTNTTNVTTVTQSFIGPNFSSFQPYATLIGITVTVLLTLMGWKFGEKAGATGGVVMGLIMTAYLGLMNWYIFYIFIFGIALLLAKIFVDRFIGGD